MAPVLFARIGLAALALAGCTAPSADLPDPLLATDTYSSEIVRFSGECSEWDDWDKPAEPFRIHGNTWYVGTCGISAILVTGEDGHALIDSGTEAGADVVLANIRKAGFDPADIRVLLASHEHFDHVGGMAKLQAASGAPFIHSEEGVAVMLTGRDDPDDPQFGMHDPMATLEEAMPYSYGNAPYLIDYHGISPIPTPGHTPGAMSWSWQSCEGDDCRTVVYADSLSPISNDTYRFSDHPQYLAAYREGFRRLRQTKCDILLTPHPSASRMVARSATGTFVGGMTCEKYVESTEQRLDARLAKDNTGE